MSAPLSLRGIAFAFLTSRESFDTVARTVLAFAESLSEVAKRLGPTEPAGRLALDAAESLSIIVAKAMETERPQ